MALLVIFYDGQCPLCCREMQHLKRLDNDNSIRLVDVYSSTFKTDYSYIRFDDALKVLHGEYQGKILYGLEVTYRAWILVGKGVWVAPLNWPVFKQMSQVIYRLFAKYRQPISRFFSRFISDDSKRCSSGVCYDKTSNSDRRR